MIDNYDYKIIGRLMGHARATWAELGALLGLSAPAAADRVRRLEEKGVIKGYAAVIDPETVDCGLLAFVAVSLGDSGGRAEFLERVRNMAEVQECHHVAGDEDYWLKIRCRGTRDLERIISDEIKSWPGNARTKTTIALSTVKETTALPLPSRE